MISRLGLRFRPASQADLEAHAGTLALLAEDLADLPPDLLERAIQRHVVASPYMPKAAELIRLAQDIERSERLAPLVRQGPSYAHDLAEFYNGQRQRGDIEWYVDPNGEVAIRASR